MLRKKKKKKNLPVYSVKITPPDNLQLYEEKETQSEKLTGKDKKVLK